MRLKREFIMFLTRATRYYRISGRHGGLRDRHGGIDKGFKSNKSQIQFYFSHFILVRLETT